MALRPHVHTLHFIPARSRFGTCSADWQIVCDPDLLGDPSRGYVLWVGGRDMEVGPKGTGHVSCPSFQVGHHNGVEWLLSSDDLGVDH